MVNPVPVYETNTSGHVQYPLYHDAVINVPSPDVLRLSGRQGFYVSTPVLVPRTF